LGTTLGVRLREAIHTVFGQEQPAARFYLMLCIAVYLVTALKGGHFNPLSGIPVIEALRFGALGTGASEPWRYLSAMFVHFSVMHILFNMMTLNDLGRLLEPRIGSGRFLCAFLGTGIAGFIASSLWYEWWGEPSLTAGASGGLMGLIGVFIGILRARKDPRWKQILGRVFVYGLIFAIVFPVNNAAHVGGLLAGSGLGFWYGREKRAAQNTRWYNALAAILVVLSLASIAASYVSVQQRFSLALPQRDPM
jgi:rhomboid protease GluP